MDGANGTDGPIEPAGKAMILPTENAMHDAFKKCTQTTGCIESSVQLLQLVSTIVLANNLAIEAQTVMSMVSAAGDVEDRPMDMEFFATWFTNHFREPTREEQLVIQSSKNSGLRRVSKRSSTETGAISAVP